MPDHADIDHTGLTGAGGSVATDAIFDAKGDLAAGTGANTAAKLTVGANDTILMADSGQSTGLKWVAAGTPTDQDYDDVAAVGTADTFARGDHLHGMPAAASGAAFKGAKAYTTGQTANSAVIVFGSGEIFDTDGFHSLASDQSRMTIPTTGYYEIKASGFVSRTDARLSIYVNGAIVRGGNTSGASTNNYASTSAILNLTAADYVEIFANTTTTTTFGDSGNIGDNFVFSVVFLGA